ncbi:hypothetical protein JTB14_037336 [Gonioctena quinquepunctata]|nr:hypothetical protein JTB14_037336 [Gonioctena quinquepunctata]
MWKNRKNIMELHMRRSGKQTRSLPEPDAIRLQSVNIPEDAVIPSYTDNQPLVIVTIGQAQFHELIDTGAFRSCASEIVVRSRGSIGLKSITKAETQSSQHDNRTRPRQS